MILPVEIDIFGIMEENAYFFVDDETLSGFLIDPGAEADKLLHIIEHEKFTIEKILLTHGHYDHIGAVNDLRRALNIPVCMGRGGNFYARDTGNNGSKYYEVETTIDGVTILDDHEEISLSVNPNFKLQVIAAPGHTIDSTIYYNEKKRIAFVGDTIFFGGRGRTDLAGGSEIDLMNTIKNRVFALPDETVLYCGHGLSTTVAQEKVRPWYRS